MKKIILVSIFLVFTIFLIAENKNLILIKNATIIPVTSDKIENGSILIENGKIKEIGKEIDFPEGAKVIDAKGKFVYPGFIDGFTHLGLIEISSQ